MIQIHLDLSIDPAKEAQMLQYFEDTFRPTAMQFEGYVEVNMLKLRSALKGTAPEGINYRFSLVYQSEELRQKWLTSEIHGTVWGNMEQTFLSTDYTVLLFDVASTGR